MLYVVPATYCGDAQVPPALEELDEDAIELDDLTLELATLALEGFELETQLTDDTELTDELAPSQTPSNDHSWYWPE